MDEHVVLPRNLPEMEMGECRRFRMLVQFMINARGHPEIGEQEFIKLEDIIRLLDTIILYGADRYDEGDQVILEVLIDMFADSFVELLTALARN